MQTSQKTHWVNKESAVEQRKWFLVDMDGQVLGRAATQIASVLRGKHKPTFTPNTDVGDFVVVINAAKVRLTGAKLKDKLYRYHTQYPGGLRETSAEKLLATYPERVIEAAVRGMLPKNKLGRQMLKKLKIYGGAEHKHEAQQPEPLSLGSSS